MPATANQPVVAVLGEQVLRLVREPTDETPVDREDIAQNLTEVFRKADRERKTIKLVVILGREIAMEEVFDGSAEEEVDVRELVEEIMARFETGDRDSKKVTLTVYSS